MWLVMIFTSHFKNIKINATSEYINTENNCRKTKIFKN